MRNEDRLFWTVFSTQRRSVAEKLERGEVHRPDWKLSAACKGTPVDRDGQLHRNAYTWMVQRFEESKKRPMPNAPAWVVFSADRAKRAVKDEAQEVILEFRVPTEELFITQYRHSPMCDWECVLRGEACHVQTCSVYGCSHGATPQSIRETWDQLLVLSDDCSDWQGVLDRFEPSWYRGRIDVL